MKLTPEMRATICKALADEGQDLIEPLDESIFLAGYRLGVQDAAKEADAYSSDADYCEAFRVAKLLARAIRSLIEDTNNG